MDGRYQRYENYFSFSDSAFAASEQSNFAEDTFDDNNTKNVGSSAFLSENQNSTSTIMSREFRSFEQEDTRLGFQHVDKMYFEMPVSVNPQMKSIGGGKIESQNINTSGSHAPQEVQARLPRQETDVDMRLKEYPSSQLELKGDRLDRTESYQTHHNPARYVPEESYESVSAVSSRDNLNSQQRKQVYTGASDRTIFSDDQSVPQDRYWRDDYEGSFHHAQEHEGYGQFSRGDERFAVDQDHYPDQGLYGYVDDVESESYDDYSQRYPPQRSENPYKSSEQPDALDYQGDNSEISGQDRWDYSRDGNYSSESAWQTKELSTPHSRGKQPSRGRGAPHFGEEMFQGQNQNRRGKPRGRGYISPRQNQMKGRGYQRGSGPGQGRGGSGLGQGRGGLGPGQWRGGSGPGQWRGGSGPGQGRGRSGPGQGRGGSGPGQGRGGSGPGQGRGGSGPGQGRGGSGPGQGRGGSGPGQGRGGSGPGQGRGGSGPGQGHGGSGPSQGHGGSGPGQGHGGSGPSQGRGGSGPGQGRGRGRGQNKPPPAKTLRGGKMGAHQETKAFMEDSVNVSQDCGQKSEHGATKKEDTVPSNKQHEEKPMKLNSNPQCSKSNLDSGQKSLEKNETENRIASGNPSNQSTTKHNLDNEKGSFGRDISSKSEKNASSNDAEKHLHSDGKDADEEDQNEEDTSFCKLCAMSFDNSEQYLRHTRGLLHTQRLMAQSSDKSGQSKKEITDSDSVSKEEHTTPTSQQAAQAQYIITDKPARPSTSSVQKNASAETSQGLALINSSGFGEDEEFEDEDEYAEEEDNGEDEVIDKEGNVEEYRCKLCDIKTTGPVSMRAHLSGRNHKLVQEAMEKGLPVPLRLMKKIGPDAQVPFTEARIPVSVVQVSGPSVLAEVLKAIPEAVVGLRAVKEYQLTKQPTFTCTICDSQCDLSSIQTHVLGSKHRMKYLKANHPAVYEHVKIHGGKKSQLSAFLEEVCTDIEAKEGRGVPSVQKPAAIENPDKEEVEKAEVSQEPSKPASNEDERDTANARSSKTPPTFTKRLPHEVVVARYQEDKRRREMDDQNFGHFERGRGRGRYHRPHNPPDFGFPEGGRGRGRRYKDYNQFPDRPPRPHFDDRWGREGDWNRGREPFHGPPSGRHPAWDSRPRGAYDDEDRIRRMYEYERYCLYHPPVGISHQDEQRRMMYEYERLGVPFEEARRRMLMQEERRMRLADMVRSGMPLDEARQRIMAEESRALLLQEYERQGLSPREARHRIIVEDERQKLLDEYDRKGIASMDAQRRIMAGDNRLHLIREFERRGMTPEEARMLAYREEEQQRHHFDLLYGDACPRRPEPLSEASLLKRHLQQGLKLEDAKNKVIAYLRAEGIPTHEAILRVEKINVTPDMLLPEQNKKTSDEREQGQSSEMIKPGAHSDSEEKLQTNIKKLADDDLDNISMEEAKERLLQEYMRRGVPREEARQSLISELIRQGVSPEEARRRFRDAPKAYQTGDRSLSPDPRHRTEQRDHSHRSRSTSSSRSGSLSRSRDRSKRPRPSYVEDREKGRKWSRDSYASEKSERSKGERPSHKELYPERKARSPEHYDPPTLTLGEELKRMKMKRRLEAYEKELELKQAKTSRPSSSKTPSTSTYGKTRDLQPQSTSHDPGMKSDVKDLLENLTNNLISSEDDAATALQVSKALTSALLKYRFRAAPNEEGANPQQSLASFPERRLSDAKKLFESSSKT